MPDTTTEEILDVKESSPDSSTGEEDVKENTTESSTVGKDVEMQSSSPAKRDGDGREKTIADAVQEAVESATKSYSSTDEKQKTEESSKEDGREVEEDLETTSEDKKTEKEETKETDKVDEKLPFSKHPRWKEVLKERDGYKIELEKTKPLAESAVAISTFCQKHNITEDDFREALDMARLARSDPKGFRERLQTYVDNIDISSGTRLPVDLQKKVDNGVVDLETAQELAKSRLAMTTEKQRYTQTQQQLDQQRYQSLTNALSIWEDSKRKLDPDYVKQFDMISDRFTALQSVNLPRTPAEAVALAEQAYKDVKSRLVRFVPKPPKRKVLQTRSSSSKSGDGLKLDTWADLGKIVQSAANKSR